MPPLSPHLFWDVRYADVDPGDHADWLVGRVLSHGRWSDWLALQEFYGWDVLKEIVSRLRIADPRSRAFCEVWFSEKTES